MAVAKTARVAGTEFLSPDTILLDLVAAEPLGFIGGQYLIVDSRIVLPSGKAVKRAYSLLSRDAEQVQFQLAVQRLPDGPGSAFMHRLQPGAEVSFSGPWGKCVPRAPSSVGTLVLATDTGITAALGLLRAAAYAPRLATTRLFWLRGSSEYFLPEAFVRAQVPAECGEVRIETMPAVGHQDRIPHVQALLQELLARGGFDQAFLAGDGAVNQVAFDDLAAAGLSGVREHHVESFFNMPKKSA